MIVPLFLVAAFLQAAPAPRGPVLRLADAEKTALAHQPAIRQARAQTTAAEARADQARAPMFPQVTGIASYQRVRSSGFGSFRGTSTGTGGTGTGTGTGTTSPTNPTTPTGLGTTPTVGITSPTGLNVFTVGATASQVLWDFGQAYHRARAADKLALSAEAQQKVAEIDVLRNVRRAYFAARAERALVDVAAETLANLERHLAQIQGFVTVGTRPEIDLAQARTDVANARVQLVNAQAAYAIAKTQLSQALGDPTGSIAYEVGDDELPPVDGEELEVAPLAAKAEKARPELLALERQREGQEMTVRQYKGAYGPTLSANGTYQEIGTSPDALRPAWNVGVSLNWPLFQGGLTRGLVREAEANVEVTRAQMDAERLQVGLDVQQATLTLRVAKATELATRDVVVNAQERLRLAEGRYAQGVGSIIELGDAQVALTQANAQLVQARFNVSSSRADLLAALGKR